jgi:hypothetical protein
MTDIQPEVTSDQTPAGDGAMIPKSVYDAEVQRHIKERNLFKPAQQRLSALADEQREAILGLADAAARGDMEAIMDWSIGTLENISGKSAAEAIAARQAKAGVGEAVGRGNEPALATPPTPQLTDDRVRELAVQAASREFEKQQTIREVNSSLVAGGYEPGTPEAYAIILIGRDNNIPIKDAVAQYEALTDARVQARLARIAEGQQQAAVVAGQTPAPAPSGQPVGAVPSNLTPKERAIARLQSTGA